MRLVEVVETTTRVAATSSRTAKRDVLADLLRRARPDEVAIAVGFLVGEPRQGRIGVGWATLSGVATRPATDPVLDLHDVDRYLDALAATSGPGSAAERARVLADMLGRATEPEDAFLRRLLTGELRQGALDGVMADAVARAAGVPAAHVRRARMLSGDLGTAAAVALTGGAPALAAIGLEPLRGVEPMLAATAESVDDAVADAGGPVSVEWKLDGARIQVHRAGERVRVFTRNLNDVTDRLPGVVEMARRLPASAVVLDGEILGLTDEVSPGDAAPKAFQDTMSSFGRHEPGTAGAALRPFVFDVLHVDGHDLIDEPLSDRLAVLEALAPTWRVPGIVTAESAVARRFADAAVAAGHEGVMVKSIESTYAAGRRGRAWRKVKPVHTLDLVVLAAEWGHGRRTGWLSNLHLGARDPATADFVMVGKTFKGLTDAMLAWQTEALAQLEIGREGHVVHVRPELVVEIALDGVQVSRRYPGGVALRFARVRRYRTDKPARSADTIDAVQALLPPRR